MTGAAVDTTEVLQSTCAPTCASWSFAHARSVRTASSRRPRCRTGSRRPHRRHRGKGRSCAGRPGDRPGGGKANGADAQGGGRGIARAFRRDISDGRADRGRRSGSIGATASTDREPAWWSRWRTPRRTREHAPCRRAAGGRPHEPAADGRDRRRHRRRLRQGRRRQIHGRGQPGGGVGARRPEGRADGCRYLRSLGAADAGR